MKFSSLFVAIVTLLQVAAASSIDLNKVAPFAQPTASTSAQKAAVKFKPRLSIGSGACVSFPAVNSAGDTSSGLSEEGKGSTDCTNAPLGSQVYGRAAWYNTRFAILYAWYFPKGFWNDYPTRRHDWASAVVWIDNPDSNTPKILGLSLSTADWEYSTQAPATSGISDGTTPKLSHELSVECGDPYLTTTDGSGDFQPLIMWEQLTTAARTALNSADFGNAKVPTSDVNFEMKLKSAWPFSGQKVRRTTCSHS
ncbi:necrosis inducing-like protein NPP1 type [Phytophthora sojae]|uniref:Necrosis inducing-like protein NPP1 type n=1 Tax=Phytophthora sojae (strain P6497) TaxID=1094619 RepID=G4YVQ1_PHYSP|nr:necrosis inducing-like protein NPP1 type [Phytophthora sojae]EGZ23149.1 necrosis inducing-like protein NPP1 type [Phytophthora sojae]|eukprot:XP_009518437.1 necrosis inducing-like protein NPP1 type [Phytophthora sojae]